ncbi:MAG: polysaccharide biosynthesis protein [Woeseiaceae bacterium]|nr:polysaccharide biosynthesis protein [Woeseiaceae bacterium]
MQSEENSNGMPRTGAKTVLVVLGATGHFGRRIARRLASETGVQLVLTSRQQTAADELASELQNNWPKGDIKGAVLDQHAEDFERRLAALQPEIVLHTAGPYQGQDYRVAKACIGCGSHYIDLADGRQFVQEFGTLHEEALQNDVLLVTGASTLPGLSSAVVQEMSAQFATISDIDVSIAPAHQTPRGAGTVAAVLSYCGKAHDVLENGRRERRFGWQDLRLQRYPQLGRRLSGACDVPDLVLFPKYIQGLKTIRFHAALEAWWEQIALWLMAWAVRLRVIKNWARFTKGFQSLSRRLLWLGSDTGGMQIQVAGTDPSGSEKKVTWNLLARDNHGPEIPCSPALIIARRMLAGSMQQRGAIHCFGLFDLSDFDREVSELSIEWAMEDKS